MTTTDKQGDVQDDDKKDDGAQPAKPKFLAPVKPIAPPAGLANAKPGGPKKPNSFHSANRVGKKSSGNR